MPSSSLFRNPSDLLIHDHFHLKDLFAEYERFVPGERERKSAMIRRIEEGLRFHFDIEELVRTATSEHRAILDSCAELSRLEGEDSQERMMKALFKQVVLYADFEEKRLLPWVRALPGVTLREMSLEIEERKGEGSRPHQD